MLLKWQRGELEDAVLGDSDPTEEGANGDSETEEEYTLYVTNPFFRLWNIHSRCLRRMEKIEDHYSALGVRSLFETHPRLEEYLRRTTDKKLITKVCCSPGGLAHPVVSRLTLHLFQISKAMSSKRAVHTTNVGQDILQYLQPTSEVSLGLNLPGGPTKKERGLNSHITARFLIPRQHLSAFEDDPDRFITVPTTPHLQLTTTHTASSANSRVKTQSGP